MNVDSTTGEEVECSSQLTNTKMKIKAEDLSLETEAEECKLPDMAAQVGSIYDDATNTSIRSRRPQLFGDTVEQRKQIFKCENCGKCYNWNYNLNRHKRFECGIKNKFGCSMCDKRFPYKQNAAIHLRRKHKIDIVNADEMLITGHIIT